MHYELFIPGQHDDAESAMQSVGFDGYAEGAESSIVELGTERGYWIAWRCGGRGPRFNDKPDLWEPAIAFDGRPPTRYRIAIKADALPQPHELAKSGMFPGQRITLGDGRSWQMPSVPRFDRTFLIQDGDFKASIDPAVAWVHAEARRWHELAQQADTRHDAVDAVRTVYRVLCLNYRLTPELVNALGLFNSSNVQDCLLAMIGVNTEGGGNV